MDTNLDGNDSATDGIDQRLFYHQNTLQSVFALSNIAGSIVEGYLYDAYGQATVYEGGSNGEVDFGGDDVIVASGQSAQGNPYQQTGHRFEVEVRQYYYGFRYYSPQLGRWINRDPLVERSFGLQGFSVGTIAEPALPRTRRDFLSQTFSTGDFEGILFRVFSEMGTTLGDTISPEILTDADRNLYQFVGNAPVNFYDPLGLNKSKGEKYEKLVEKAKAAWTAAQYAVPGSEFAAALEVFGGCNSLGLINAWVLKKWKDCLCKKGFDAPECKKLEEKHKWLTDIWYKKCKKGK